MLDITGDGYGPVVLNFRGAESDSRESGVVCPVAKKMTNEARRRAVGGWPRSVALRAYRALRRLGRREAVCAVAIFVFTVGFRLALSGVLPHPEPSSYDEMAYLLGAELFAAGKVAGAPHPLWKFFESVQVISSPVYAPKYPPGQAAFLAVGKVALGDPFYGVLLSVGLFAAAVYWMLRAHVGPGWALLGGAGTSLYFGAGHYWTEMYWGGAVAGLGGALFVGAFARLRRGGGVGCGLALGAGALLLMNSRPYESSFLIAALCGVLAAWWWKQRSVARWGVVAVTLAGLVVAAGLTLGYNYGVTGSVVKMPYVLYMEQYASAPQFWFQPLPEAKQYRNAALELSARRYDVDSYNEIHERSVAGRVGQNLLIALVTVALDGGVLALLPLLFVPLLRRRADVRLYGAVALLLVAAITVEVVMFLHYLAPLLVVVVLLVAVTLDGLWRLRSVRARDRVVVVGVLAALLAAGPLWRLGNALAGRPGMLYRGEEFGQRRAEVARRVLREPGEHVVFVRMTAKQSPLAAWVANGADIDGSRLVWAHDRGAENAELVRYFPGRRFWMLEDWGGRVELEGYGAKDQEADH